MANENPTTKFKVDISELKAGIQESNRLIRLANSEFKAASSGMDNWANSTDGLEAKIKQLNSVQDAENEKLKNLQEQYRLTVEAQGENSRGAQELAIKINNQQAAVNKVNSELGNYEERLDLVRRAQDLAEQSGRSLEDELRDLESAADDAGDAADQSGDGFTILKGTLADLAAGAIQGAISAVGDLVGSLMELPEATKEFRTVFGAAMQSAEDSAVGAEGAKKAFEEFYKVAADEGQAAEATSHIVDLAKNEEELQKVLDGVTGAWVEYGDSISIEGLSEAAAETYKTGVLTGQMTDAINWAGESEEEFQKKLDECSTEQERQQLVVDTLNNLYGDNAKAYAESNSSILSANEANLKMLETQSELATTIEPLTAAWTNFKANALEAITPAIGFVADKLQAMAQYLKENETVATALKAVLIVLATALGILAAAFGIVNLINLVQKAFALLNTTMLANPIVLIVALIAGLVAAFIYLWTTSEEFRNFFINLWESIKTTCSDAIDAVVGFFKELPGRISEWLTNAKDKVTTWGSDLWAKAKETGSNFISGVIEFFKTLPGKIWGWLVQTVTKIVTWKNDLIAKGKEAAQGLFDSIVNKIKEIPDKMLSIGGDIVKGLWNGINNMTDWVIGKIKGFTGNVLGGIKDFFGIESPSKVMRDVVGKNLVKGMAVGVEDESGALNRSIKNSLSGSIDAARSSLRSATANGITGTPGGSNVTYNFNQTNNSPKSLSRLEIYRQTRNQFRQLSEV